jgi:16S rRNA processing protein RimM
VYFPRDLADEDDTPTLASLVGFDLVEASNNKKVGTIASIDDSTANILFELEDGRLIPATDDLITDINTKDRTIKMEIPEGLLEL